MNSCLSKPPARRLHSARHGNSLTFAIVVMLAVCLLAFAGWWFLGRRTGKQAPTYLTSTVSRGPYDFIVIEQGEVQSAQNIELRCEVRSRSGGSGITVIEVIPEGTSVQPGDVLVRLDSSALEQEKVTQQIKVNSQQSLVVQAENTLAAAIIARQEYLEGTFTQDEKLITSEKFVAEQNLRTAEIGLASARRLQSRNIITALQLEGAQFAVDKAQNELEGAEIKLRVLRDLTKQKMLKQFDSDIATAEAKVGAEKSSLNLEQDKLKDIEDQIAKCTIRAPNAGQVVYANEYSSRSGSAEFVVEAGATVREQQPILRIPSSNEMQVKATVNEARVTLVRVGLPVTIRVDALRDEVVQGEVIRVNPYAEPGGWSSGNVKKYATYVKILNPPANLRSGMNAEVRIHVERMKDALQVPVQALAEYKGRFFSLVNSGGKLETREVKVASTNDKFAVIESGVGEGDVLVMNPRGLGSILDLPDLPDVNVAKDTEIARTQPGEAVVTPTAATGGGPPGEGGPPGARQKGKGKGGNFSPAMLVDRAMESDADKDGKISTAEMATMDDRRKQMLAGADANADGFIDRAEVTTAVAAAMQRRSQAGGPGGPGGGGGGPAAGGE